MGWFHVAFEDPDHGLWTMGSDAFTTGTSGPVWTLSPILERFVSARILTTEFYVGHTAVFRTFLYEKRTMAHVKQVPN